MGAHMHPPSEINILKTPPPGRDGVCRKKPRISYELLLILEESVQKTYLDLLEFLVGIRNRGPMRSTNVYIYDGRKKKRTQKYLAKTQRKRPNSNNTSNLELSFRG
jgi:hypothetical protein